MDRIEKSYIEEFQRRLINEITCVAREAKGRQRSDQEKYLQHIEVLSELINSIENFKDSLSLYEKFVEREKPNDKPEDMEF